MRRQRERAGESSGTRLPLQAVSRVVLALALVVTPSTAAGQDTGLPDLDRAAWIWASAPEGEAPAPVCFFRKTLDLQAVPAQATVLITADNVYDLYVNGSFVGGDGGSAAIYWQSIERFDITDLLVAGTNVVAVEGRCLGGAAGLIAALRIESSGGDVSTVITDRTWLVQVDREPDWKTFGHEGDGWSAAAEIAGASQGIWGPLSFPEPTSPGTRSRPVILEPGPDFAYPSGVVFVAQNVEVSNPEALNIFRIGETRAYFENDIPSPAALGRALYALVPAAQDGELILLHDAGDGVLGSPSVSFDGGSVYFAMAPSGDAFFHVYRVDADGASLTALTRGPFHDYDPQPLPDGRIVFSSTRIGSRDEYHGNVASCLFVVNADGSDIRPLTHHIVGDREPRVAADGGLVFIRSDNFLQRAKVETRIHRTRLDGTGGAVVLGAERGTIGYDQLSGAEHNSAWLREFGAGSPAPLPDGRVAAITHLGLVVAGAGRITRVPVTPAPYDIAPLPDGRLLCTLPQRDGAGVIELGSGEVTRAFAFDDLHSVTYLGRRSEPPAMAVTVADVDRLDATGFLLCQNVLRTKQSSVDTSRIQAVRVYEGRPLTTRSVGHHLVHIGVEAVELGTVPLAPDGSFYVEVPADRPLALQAVDAEGRSVVNELTWIYVRPGERRTCVGCHEPRLRAPEAAGSALAVHSEPLALLGQGRAHRYRGNNPANGGVLNLQLDRFREVASIDLYSEPGLASEPSTAVPTSGRSEEVERLCAELASDQTELRISAARRLSIFRDRASTGPLSAALGDSDAQVRCAAALALSACGTHAAVPMLLAALADEHPLVAQAAAVALEHLTANELGFDAFAEDRQAAVRVWEQWFEAHDWAEIEAKLAASVLGDDPRATHRAIEALGHGSGPTGREALRSYLARRWPAGELRTVQAAMRALGHLRDPSAVPLLVDILQQSAHAEPPASPQLHELGWTGRHVHLAATAAEALGWIGTPTAESALIDAVAELRDFWIYTFQTGDHDWLRGCHASTVHFRIIEALDAMGSRRLAPLVPDVLRSVPIDADRGLLLENDSYEVLVARVVRGAGRTVEVVETALRELGDPDAASTADLVAAVTSSPPATEVKPESRETRAAQLLSVMNLDARHARSIGAALSRYRAMPSSRTRESVCFYLCRALGKIADPGSADLLLTILRDDPTEASFGLHDPPSAFIYRARPPFYRAAAAAALGRIGDSRATPTLVAVVSDFDNAISVRHAAAAALGSVGDHSTLPELRELAEKYPEVITRRALLESCRRIAARLPSPAQPRLQGERNP